MSDAIKKQIGLNIDALLHERKIKQKELAAVLEVSDNVVSYFVKGVRQPNIEQLIKMSKLFKVSIDTLVKNSNDAKCQTEDRPSQCSRILIDEIVSDRSGALEIISSGGKTVVKLNGVTFQHITKVAFTAEGHKGVTLMLEMDIC